MLNLPEKVEDFDYNLKLAVDNIPAADTNSTPDPAETDKPKGDVDENAKIDFPPDAFLMVTQCNWEEDVVWNGDDIKHKVSFVQNVPVLLRQVCTLGRGQLFFQFHC